jgi:hypothetical protein
MPLQIVRIKPNPAGRDRNRYGQTPAAQLAAEWVTIHQLPRSFI